jgi:hypothetical protein
MKQSARNKFYNTSNFEHSELGHPAGPPQLKLTPLSPIDWAQLGLEVGSGARVSSNVNGTTACSSHVCGKTGARQIIEGSTEYGAYSWAISGWTWNSGLSLTVASWAVAAEVKMNIDPAARANCKDFRIVFLRRFLLSAARWQRGRLLRVPAADGRTMQEFPPSGGYLI